MLISVSLAEATGERRPAPDGSGLGGRCRRGQTEPTVYDLLVTMPDGIKRIQVKTTTYRGKTAGSSLSLIHI